MRKLRKAAVVVAVFGSVGLLGAGTSYAGTDAGGHSGHPEPVRQTTHRQQASPHTIRHQTSRSGIIVRQEPPRYIIVRQQPSRTIIVRHRPSRSTVMRQQTTVINGQPQQQTAPQQAAPAPAQPQQAAPQPQQQASPSTAPRQQSNRGRHEGGHVLVLRQSSACGTYDKNVDVFGEVGVANGWLPLHRWHDRRGDQHVRIGTSMGCNNVAHL
ncbi:hypothetical protein [Streptomyces sp. S186]|uniref:hypothetical protein n=1 Tax=Streptomyces sp. S186 TaxID=3434395 RepID=UPI003F66D77B